MDKDTLEQLYIKEGKTLVECSKILGVHKQTIVRWIKKYELKKTDTTFKITKEQLEQEYIVNNKTIPECAKTFNVSKKVITNRIKEYNIIKPKKLLNKQKSDNTKKQWETGNLKEYSKDNVNKLMQWRKNNPQAYQESLQKAGNSSISKLKQWCEDNPDKFRESRNTSGIKLKQWQKDNSDLFKYIMKNAIIKSISPEIQGENMKRFGVPFPCMRPECYTQSKQKISKINLYWNEAIKELGYTTQVEYALQSFSYDIFVKDLGILLEINPSVTHNTIKNFFSKSGKACTPDYHYRKSRTATENKYHCIHVWDWDNKDKILNLFKQKERIPARKLEIKQIFSKEANIFNNKYHLQNTCRGQDIIYGLYYNQELVSLMSFGKPRYNKNYQWELLRYTTHPDYKVIGGAERIFKHFIQDFNPESIISYCDYSKFTGQVYEKLGFNKLKLTHPTAHWIKGKIRITQAQLNKYGFDKLLGAEYGYYGKGTNNQELMLHCGFVQVYDCGQMVFVWQKPKSS